ncbi:MAG: hypothetical protein EBX52_10760, partial [Proteobacteria bacterium]|nr:hypothetical protein [Pseudomonadota bacterium]
SRFLRNRKELSSRDFSSLMGVLSLACLLPVVWVSSNAAEWVARPGFGMFVLISAVLGWGSSWLANWLWNFSAKHIPSEVSGLLLVFETIFGLFYTFLYEHRLPHVFEAVSIGLSLGGVVLAVIAQVSAPDLESGSTPV